MPIYVEKHHVPIPNPCGSGTPKIFARNHKNIKVCTEDSHMDSLSQWVGQKCGSNFHGILNK